MCGAPPKEGGDDYVDVDVQRITVTADGLRVASLPPSVDVIVYDGPYTSEPGELDNKLKLFERNVRR